MSIKTYQHHPHQGFQKGYTPWNKNKTKKDFPQLSNSGVKKGHPNKGCFKKGHKPIAGFKKGNIPWSKFHPEFMTGKNNPLWKGGKTKRDGYIFIRKPNHPFANGCGYVREHRLVVEKQIGRYLLPKEKTHHLGAKDDNKPQMLMAFVSHSAHRRFHHNPKNVKLSEIIFDGRKIK